MMDAQYWRRALISASDAATQRMFVDVRREFARAALEYSKPAPALTLPYSQHEARLHLIIATHARRTWYTFGRVTLAMLAQSENEKKQDGRQESQDARVREVISAMALQAAVAGQIDETVAILSTNRAFIAQVQSAIVTTAPSASAAAIAEKLLAEPKIVATLSEAATRARIARDATAIVDALTAPDASDPGALIVPPAPPAGTATPPPSGGGARPLRFPERVEQYVRKHALERSRTIAGTSRRDVRAILIEAAREGWGEERTARAIVERMNGGVALHRARTIARSEIGRAQNQAQLAIARERAERLGKRLVRTWVTVGDDRVRPKHAELNGTDIDEAPIEPGEEINCRCSQLMRFEPL